MSLVYPECACIKLQKCACISFSHNVVEFCQKSIVGIILNVSSSYVVWRLAMLPISLINHRHDFSLARQPVDCCNLLVFIMSVSFILSVLVLKYIRIK